MKNAPCTWQAVEQRRCDLIRAARDCFLEKGFHGVSVRRLSEALNIQPGSIYHHFTSKEDILFEIIEPYELTLTEALESIRDGDAVQMVSDYVDVYLKLSLADQLTAQLARLEFRSLNESHKAQILALRSRRALRLSSILSNGLADKSFDLPSISSSVDAIDFIFGGVIGVLACTGRMIAECKVFILKLLGVRHPI